MLVSSGCPGDCKAASYRVGGCPNKKDRFTLDPPKGKGEMGMSLECKYRETVRKVQDMLRDNSEWEDRYAKYVRKLAKREDQIKCAESRFRLTGTGLKHYLPLSSAENKINDKYTYFDLRFRGQSVAELKVPTDESRELLLSPKSEAPENLSGEISLRKTDESGEDRVWEKWTSNEANGFRRRYKRLEKAIVSGEAHLERQPEHELESALLSNFAKKSTEGKGFPNVQPVTMCHTRAFFQMPTPLNASQAMNDIISYSGEKGGGIDILCRVGDGRATYLGIIELKDENTNSEPPEKAICQAIAYATFIHALLRSKSGKGWWRFFGRGGNLPRKLTLYALVAMPDSPNAARDFAGMELSLDDCSGDCLKLGYLYKKEGTMEFDVGGLPEVCTRRTDNGPQN